MDGLLNTQNLERTIIAELFASPEYFSYADAIICEEDFSEDLSKKAYKELKSLFDERKVIDLTTIYPRIDNGYFMEVVALTTNPTIMSVTQHSEILRDASIRRKLYFLSLELTRDTMNKSISVDVLMATPERIATIIKGNYKTGNECIALNEAINALASDLEKEQVDKANHRKTRITSGFGNLDFINYGGFGKGNLIILAARPSVGKTAVMLQMAKRASSNGSAVNIYSLEMTNSELAQRLLVSTDLINQIEIARGDFGWDKFDSAVRELENCNMFLNDRLKTIDDICKSILINHQSNKCDMAFIDYLGLVGGKIENANTLAQELAGKTARLKQIAKDCGIPIVLLCQLNRESAREGRAPQLYDLRDSGGIEQDADEVLMLQDKYEMNEMGDLETKLIMWVRKNRQGKKGIGIEMKPNASYTTFEELGMVNG